MLKAIAAVITYSIIIFIAVCWQGTTSRVQFVLFSVAPILWMDRWCFNIVMRPTNEQFRWEAVRRLAWFLGSVLAIKLIWPGWVLWGDSLFLGTEISMMTFLLENFIRVGRISWRWATRKEAAQITWSIRGIESGLVFSLFILLAPLFTLHPPHSVAKRLPAVRGFTVETIRVPTADGIELHGWLMSQPDPRAVVVFCHGHKCNCGQVAQFLKVIRPLGFNVIACDFRGHGESQGDTASFGLHETEDVIAAVQFIRARYPDKPLFLVGVSYGAAVILQALQQVPNVQGVWVEGAFARFDDIVDHCFRPVPQPFRNCLAGFYDKVAWLDCGLRASDIRPIDCLQNVRVPICFCHGCLDDLIPFSQAQAVYSSYSGPKSCLWLTKGNHYRLRKDYEAEYFSRLREFMEERLGATRDLTEDRENPKAAIR